MQFFPPALQKNARSKVEMPFRVGFEEDGFLKSMDLSYRDLEPLVDKATRVINLMD